MGVGNRVWGNHTVMTYLKTGVFDYWVPVGHSVHWEVSHCSLQGLPIYFCPYALAMGLLFCPKLSGSASALTDRELSSAQRIPQAIFDCLLGDAL